MRIQRTTSVARPILTVLSVAILIAALAACGDDGDAGSNSGELSVSDVWSRPVTGASAAPTSDTSGHSHDHAEEDGDPAGVTGVVYLTIENGTEADDRLLSVSTSIAEAAEIHQTTTDDGVMKMRMQESLDIPAGEAVQLEPTGLHIMLINLTRNLSEGDTFEVELTFEEHGPMTVTSTVRSP